MSVNTSLKLALFDCDGTLVDSQNSIFKAMELTCQSYQLEPLARDSVRRIVGLPLEIAMAHLFEDLPSQQHHEMAECFREHFRQMRLSDTVEEPLFPGTLDALDQLTQSGWLLGVATGKVMRGLKATLNTHDMSNRFSTLQTADRARGKPDPEMVEKALYETGVEAKNAVVIGDTTYDIHMAGNAKVKSIGVSWGYHHEDELRAAGAAEIIYDYSELNDAMNRVMES